MSTIFEVGKKVVAIKNLQIGLSEGFGIKKGQIFTINGIILVPCIDLATGQLIDSVGLLFEEIRPDAYEPGAMAFDGDFFRPLISRKTDIAVFTEMLTPARVEEPA